MCLAGNPRSVRGKAYVVQAWFESLVVQDQVCIIVPSFLLPFVRSRHWPPFITAMRLSSV